MPALTELEYIKLSVKHADNVFVFDVYHEPGYGWQCWPFTDEYFTNADDAIIRALRWVKGTYNAQGEQ